MGTSFFKKLRVVPAIIIYLLLSDVAGACSCIPDKSLDNRKKVISESLETYTAKVIESDNKKVKFKLLKAYKGRPSNYITFESERGCFDENTTSFKEGKTYLIANSNDSLEAGKVKLAICGLHDEVSTVKDVLKYLGSPEFKKTDSSVRK